LAETADITLWLDAAREGDRAALDRVLATLYQELHAMARRQLAGQLGHTLDATALVHEAYLKLVGRNAAQFDDRAHFFAYAASAMRSVVVDYARQRLAQKRGGDLHRVAELPEDLEGGLRLDEDTLGLDTALTRLAAVDPRRFGCLLWQPPGKTHELLRDLGPEPLSDAFDGDYLFARSRGRKAPVKVFLMDQKIVVGVGNIYAAEALFAAGISPLRAAGQVSLARYRALADAVKAILAAAIARGGTTLRDFISPDGAPGYFEQELAAYGRGGEPCPRCGRALKSAAIGQRATAWCGHCQR
jgi:RNA polymerase sigma factor (TIGR02999 family)